MAKKSAIRVYERDSMERFGDDLTEQVIQYLWLEEKVRFEYVCKQWQRLVFNKQMEIDLNLYTDLKERKNTLFRLIRNVDNRGNLISSPLFYYKVDIQLLESLLKKCQNIRRVHLNINQNGKELELITKYCRRVTKLIGPKCCNETLLMSFATKHGMCLKEFGTDEEDFDSLPDYLKKFLQMCPNLKSIDIPIDNDFNEITYESDSLSKLEVIKDIIIDENEKQCLGILNTKYGKSLKRLRIVFNELSFNELKTCFAHISRFESLQSLKLIFCSFLTEEPIDECLKLLANNCTKLRELRFCTYNRRFNRIFSFSEFSSLERLVIRFSYTTDKLEGSVECLKHMTRLKHLLITHPQLTPDFFANIQTILPNIRFLEINANNINAELFKPFVESLQTMKCIESVVINNDMKFNYCKNRSESKPRILTENNY